MVHERALVGGRLVEPVGAAHAGDGALERRLVGGVDAGERGVGLDEVARRVGSSNMACRSLSLSAEAYPSARRRDTWEIDFWVTVI